MRLITILTGLAFVGGGVVALSNTGITFMSIAFPMGILFLIGGIIEIFSYVGYRGDNDDKAWVLIDGSTTLILGALILFNKISVDVVVPPVMAIWVIITGLRNLIHALDDVKEKKERFYDHLTVGILNLLVGLYVFYNNDFFVLPTVTLVCLCVIVQGINIANIGMTIHIRKPDFAKTEEEKIAEAEAKANAAHEHARNAVKAAIAAKAEYESVSTKMQKNASPEPEVELSDTSKITAESGSENETSAEAENKSEAEAEETSEKAEPEDNAAEKPDDREIDAKKVEAPSEAPSKKNTKKHRK